METLFLSIQKRIADNMPELSLVDEDYGQLNTEEDTYPVTFPCSLIQVEEIDWQDLGAGKQKGTVNIRVKLAIDCYDDTHYTSGTAQKAAERMLMYKKMHTQLNMFKGGILKDDDGIVIDKHFTPMKRVKSVFYSLPGGIKVYEGIYSCQILDL
ncbi:hypothetical protein SAMN05216364_10067 [Porphyromonadaceae bacterium KHP3R9]|nr:hypothetical protein SAMN05216364_10067 [Porphyromonadaceae bacterium KHP3R9]